MYALNYLHMGEAKTWYVVPGAEKQKFEEIFKSRYAEVFMKNPSTLYHINTMVSPAELVRNHCTVYRTEQKPGEYILTFP